MEISAKLFTTFIVVDFMDIDGCCRTTASLFDRQRKRENLIDYNVFESVYNFITFFNIASWRLGCLKGNESVIKLNT